VLVARGPIPSTFIVTGAAGLQVGAGGRWMRYEIRIKRNKYRWPTLNSFLSYFVMGGGPAKARSSGRPDLGLTSCGQALDQLEG
jgi:hypothetical protein